MPAVTRQLAVPSTWNIIEADCRPAAVVQAWCSHSMWEWGFQPLSDWVKHAEMGPIMRKSPWEQCHFPNHIWLPHSSEVLRPAFPAGRAAWGTTDPPCVKQTHHV